MEMKTIIKKRNVPLTRKNALKKIQEIKESIQLHSLSNNKLTIEEDMSKKNIKFVPYSNLFKKPDYIENSVNQIIMKNEGNDYKDALNAFELEQYKRFDDERSLIYSKYSNNI